MPATKVYPALKGTMGTGLHQQTYFLVTMPVKDLISEVGFIQDIVLNEEISKDLQREIKISRAKKIMDFLGRDDRFVSSIVVAALGGNPDFVPISGSNENPLIRMVENDQSFGVLTFQGGEDYYALDGQHRLYALKKKADDDPKIRKDEIPIILVLADERIERNVIRNRRLFTWMNRYAKPTTTETNIIMDEDDLYAIVTRRLVLEHNMFQKHIPDKQISKIRRIMLDNQEDPKVNVRSNSIRTDSGYFTTIQTLYDFTKRTLDSVFQFSEDVSLLTLDRDNELIEKCYEFSSGLWDSLSQTIEGLDNNPSSMRSDTDEGNNHCWFRPIGQLVLARVVADLINGYEPYEEKTLVKDLNVLLSPLSYIDWDLRDPPWLNILTYESEDGKYKMRAETRQNGIKAAHQILSAMLNEDVKIEKPLSKWRLHVINVPQYQIGKEWSEVRKRITSTRSKIRKNLRSISGN